MKEVVAEVWIADPKLNVVSEDANEKEIVL